MLAALSAVTGAATGFFNPASTGFLPSVQSPRRLQQANALRGLVASAGRIAGPIAAGVLVATVGAGWALAVDAATFAVSAAFLSRIRLPRLAADAAPGSYLADLREGWDAFRSRRWLWSFVAWGAFANLLYGCWAVVGPLVAERDLGSAGSRRGRRSSPRSASRADLRRGRDRAAGEPAAAELSSSPPRRC